MAQRVAFGIVASGSNRSASHHSGVGYSEALRHLPRAVSVVTFRRGADRLGLTATWLSSLSLEPPTLLISFDGEAGISPAAATAASFGVSVLGASHVELADRFARGAPIEAAPDESGASWVTATSGVTIRSDAVAAFECESEEVVERHGRAIVIARIRNVFKVGGSGALVYWLGAYNSIGWTDDEVRRAVGLFPATRS
jgi:flavin reductase (DIM6/NTAB) family NADH-FMN oxidoreductase RutF